MRLNTALLRGVEVFSVTQGTQGTQKPFSEGKRSEVAVSQPCFHRDTEGHRTAEPYKNPVLCPAVSRGNEAVTQEKSFEINAVPLVSLVSLENGHEVVKTGAAGSAGATVSPVPPRENGCGTCEHRTRAKVCAEPVAAGLAPHHRVVFVEQIGAHGSTCKAYKRRQVRSSKPDADQARVAAGVLMPSRAELRDAVRYAARADRYGMSQDEGERFALFLIKRDRDFDGRKSCIECASLEFGGRCNKARLGLLPGTRHDFRPNIYELHRCPKFRDANNPQGETQLNTAEEAENKSGEISGIHTILSNLTGWRITARGNDRLTLEGVPGWSILACGGGYRHGEHDCDEWPHVIAHARRTGGVPALLSRQGGAGWRATWPAAVHLAMQRADYWRGHEWTVSGSVDVFAAVLLYINPKGAR